MVKDDENGYDEAVAESFPASDPPSHAGGNVEEDPHSYGEHGGGIGRPEQEDPGQAGRRHRVRARPWRGDDRCDHLLHQHLQPQRDDRRRPGGQEGGRSRVVAQAVGEDHARARVEGGDRLLRRPRAWTSTWTRSASIWSVTAAPPASANSGPLIPEVSAAVQASDLAVVSVLSGNRNFEGRINPDIKMNYLASPPLVVAYAIAGTMDIDLMNDSLGNEPPGRRRLPEGHLADRGGDRRDRRVGDRVGDVHQLLRRCVRR